MDFAGERSSIIAPTYPVPSGPSCFVRSFKGADLAFASGIVVEIVFVRTLLRSGFWSLSHPVVRPSAAFDDIPSLTLPIRKAFVCILLHPTRCLSGRRLGTYMYVCVLRSKEGG